MRSYVGITGVMFALVVIAHLWRAAEEGAQLVRTPLFIVTTLLSLAMALWAVRLWRTARS